MGWSGIWKEEKQKIKEEKKKAFSSPKQVTPLIFENKDKNNIIHLFASSSISSFFLFSHINFKKKENKRIFTENLYTMHYSLNILVIIVFIPDHWQYL